MEPVETYKSFALFSFIIMILAGSVMVWKGPKDKTKSVSYHAGTANKKLYGIYAFTFLTSTILFYLFGIFWFIPTFNLSFGFSFFLHLMTVLLILTALIPESGKYIKAHAIVAYGFAFMMMVLLFFLATAPLVSLFARILSGVSGCWLAFTWYLYFFSPFKQKVIKHYLFYQYSYVILFCLSILAVTYY